MRTTAQRFADAFNGLKALREEFGIDVPLTLGDLQSRYCVGARTKGSYLHFVDGSTAALEGGRLVVIPIQKEA